MVTTHTKPSVEELRRAYFAACRGDFRQPADPRGRQLQGGQAWEPAEQVVPVVGCHGGAGASTTALAIATAAGRGVRVVEAGAATTSGFCAASTAELGVTESGWALGQRAPQVRLERGSHLPLVPEDVPLPDEAVDGTALTVLDVTWEPRALYCGTSWLTGAVFESPRPVLVTTATVPGMRHLEAVLDLFSPEAAPVIVVRGQTHRRGRWADAVEQTLSPLVSAARQDGRVIVLPLDSGLAVRGLDTDPLPAALVAAGSQILHLFGAGNSKENR